MLCRRSIDRGGALGVRLNTIFSDRLPNDPRFKALCREIGDPLRAIGALYFIWSGTQNIGLLEATNEQLKDCFPVGYRGVKSAISALYRSGWLQGSHDPLRIVGNLEHVAKKNEISNRNRQAALARWKPDDECTTHAARMPVASIPHATGMPTYYTVHPGTPLTSTIEGSAHALVGRVEEPDPPLPQTDDLATIAASQIPASEALEIWNHYQARTELRNLTRLPLPVGMDLAHCRAILHMAGRHMVLAKRIVDAYVAYNGNAWWTSKKWPLWALARQRDFDEALQLARGSEARTSEDRGLPE